MPGLMVLIYSKGIEGSIPDSLIGVPQDWTPHQIKQFQD